MDYDNYMELNFSSKTENESFARVTVAAFVSQLDPNISEITDIKTAISEAVTNSIIHGYEGGEGVVNLKCGYKGRDVYIEISDTGRGIEDIEKARQPMYTSKPEFERSGMGFTVMEMFMDSVVVVSKPFEGTTVTLEKSLKG